MSDETFTAPHIPTSTGVTWGATAAPATSTGVTSNASAPAQRCPVCGGVLTYGAGASALVCDSCGNRVAIAHEAGEHVEEHGYDQWLASNPGYSVASIGSRTAVCAGCGATTETTDLAGRCQFCGADLVATSTPAGVIPPEAVLPFAVDSRTARDNFTKWVRSRWFAPGALKQVGDTESIRGTYLPHWTFDATTTSSYLGERGEHYWEKEGDQQVQRTRWHHVSGVVREAFDDVLVPASNTVPRHHLDKLGPWTLGAVVPFKPDYLMGYSAPRYDVDPQAGYADARTTMDRAIRRDVEQDIGGDEQRVQHVETTYADVMFKLVLLPIWLATFMYAGKQWQVLVNANTGEVVGDRPWSVPKIVAAGVAGLVVLALVLWLWAGHQ